MPQLAHASIHVKRHLSQRELATIAVALQALRVGPCVVEHEPLIAQYCGDAGLLPNDDIDALTRELTTARKVKVCRSKRREGA